MKRNWLICTGLMFAGAVYAQAPVVNISKQHGNLRDAQGYLLQAYQKVETAQADNRYKLSGHAEKAKELIRQADAELKLAAEAANAAR